MATLMIGLGSCLRLSCRPKARLLLHDRRQRLGPASLPDQRRQSCVRHSCTTGKERLISRWEHEAVLETVQARLDQHPEKMTIRRQTAEHPFGTIKCWMGATHFLTKRLPKVATEMALNVLAYNIKRVMAIIGVAGLLPWPPKPRDTACSNQCEQT